MECESYVSVGIYASISWFLVMCGWCLVMCGDVQWCAVMCGFQALPAEADVITSTKEVMSSVVRIWRQETENSACVTCKFYAPFSWILYTFQADFSTLILSVALLYDCVCHTCILAQFSFICSFYCLHLNLKKNFLVLFSTGVGSKYILFWQPERQRERERNLPHI